MVDKVSHFTALTSPPVHYYDITLYPRTKDSVYYDDNTDSRWSMFYDEIVPDFKCRLVKNLDFSTYCSECVFNYEDLLMIHIFGTGLEDPTNVSILEKCMNTIFNRFKKLEDLWVKLAVKKKIQYYLNGDFYTVFKLITDNIVNILKLYKRLVFVYDCESFYALYMPTFTNCLIRRKHQNNCGHHGMKLSTNFFDHSTKLFKQIVGNYRYK